MSHPLPPKKEVALALLERSMVHVHLDPRATGVVVPEGLKKEPQLLLHIGLNLPVPIPDLRLDDAGMTCTLSFARTPFYCVIPWGSVFAMVGDDGRGMVWPDDVPPELAKGARAQRPPQQAQPADAKADGVKKGRKGPEEARDSKAPSSRKPKSAPGSKKRRGGSDQPADGAAGGNGRPMLVAVPSPPPPPAAPVAVRPGERRERAPASANGKGAPKGDHAQAGNGAHDRPAARPAARRPGGNKPKREIPPYLRVVK